MGRVKSQDDAEAGVKEGKTAEDEGQTLDSAGAPERGSNDLKEIDSPHGKRLDDRCCISSLDMFASLVRDHGDFFSNILENLPLVIYSAKADDLCTTTFVGDQVLGLTGYTPQELLDDPDLWIYIIHEEDRSMVMAEIDEMRKQGKPSNLEYRIITKSGDIRHVRDRSMPVLDDRGRLIRFDGYMEDMTSEIVQRREVEKSEMMYRMLIEDIRDGVWAFDENIRVTFANNNMLEMLGYRLDEIIGKPGFMFADPDLIPEAEEHINKRRNGVQESFKFEFRRKDGTKLPVLVSASPIIGDDESFKGSILFIRDLTKEIETHEALEETRRRFELVQKAARIGSWDWNMNTDELVWSDQVEPIFGFEYGAFPGTFQAFMDRVHPEDRESLLAAIEECVHYGKEYIIEHRILLEDGTVKYVLEVGNVLRDGRGNPYRMVGIVKDISDKKQAEFEIRELNKELRRQTKNLQAINKELEAFSFSVSHDLKSPLRHIDGFSSLLEGYSEALDEKGRDYLSRIRSNVMRMDDLIDSLLKLSRIASQPLNWEKVDLTGLARDVAMRLEESDSRREVQFDIREGMEVWGDRNLLAVLLSNLIGNAWKFTSRRSKAEIEVGMMELENRTIFFIRDNGEGFDMQYSDKLFIPFQRIHSEKDFPGSGIGLSIVNRIINRHGGEIWFSSEVDKGTSVFFTFDVREPTIGS
ncbi:MAG: PAS domain-containing protein [Methanomassiliicoccales archaeon]|nr:PAS domain-containing protein [Methanomassiliicoccales archaeon]NYT15450.1 PAS domain-containing protein [Methanomassiliicoccales archaeon]